MFRMTKASLTGLALGVAIVLALLSVNIERIGPERAVVGNLCGSSGSDACYEPVLKGGFPVAYLFDAPGVSVERKLGFGEDDLSLAALVLDIAVYFAIALSAIVAVLRRLSARRRSTGVS